MQVGLYTLHFGAGDKRCSNAIRKNLMKKYWVTNSAGNAANVHTLGLHELMKNTRVFTSPVPNRLPSIKQQTNEQNGFFSRAAGWHKPDTRVPHGKAMNCKTITSHVTARDHLSYARGVYCMRVEERDCVCVCVGDTLRMIFNSNWKLKPIITLSCIYVNSDVHGLYSRDVCLGSDWSAWYLFACLFGNTKAVTFWRDCSVEYSIN